MSNFPDFGSFVSGFSQIVNTVPIIMYACNTSYWASNSIPPLVESSLWASNILINLVPADLFSSNTALYACNSAIYTSNIVPIVTVLGQFASNTGVYASNTLSNLPPTITSAAWSSNTLSNQPGVVSSAQFSSNAVVYASNSVLFLSNTTIWSSNVVSEWISACAYMGSISPSITSNLTITSANSLYVSGNIGVGISTPLYPIHIASSSNTSLSNFAYLSHSGPGSTPGTSNGQISLFCAQNVVAAEFDSISDQRLKTDIQDMSDEFVMRVMGNVRPRMYRYIDQFSHGALANAGFVAQELETDVGLYLPTSVNIHEGETPTVMAMYNFIRLDKNVIILQDVDPMVHDNFTPNETILSFRDHCYATHIGTVLRCVERYVTVQCLNPLPMFMEDRLFCYGEKVSNVRSVDHKQIFAVSVAATKLLITKVASQEVVISNLINELAQMKTQFTNFNSS